MNNYELELLNEQRLCEFFLKCMDICKDLIINYHKFKKSRNENGFISAVDKFFDAKEYKEKVSRGNTVKTRYLSNYDDFVHKRCYSFKAYEIERKLEKIRNAAINDYTYLNTLELLTCDNMVATMRKLLQDYLEHAKRVDELKAIINGNDVKVEDVKKPKKVKEHVVVDKDDKFYIDKILAYIKGKLNDPKANYRLDTVEEHDLREVFPDISNVRGLLFSIETINDGLKINNYLNNLSLVQKNKTSGITESPLKMICDIAVSVFDTTTLLLLSSNDNKAFEKLLMMLKLDNGLEQYEKAYTIFEEYYSGLSRRSKEDIRITYQGASFDEYRNKFGITNFHIITVDELRNRINSYIKVFIGKKSSDYVFTIMKDTVYNKLLKAIRLMDVNEIVDLYKIIYENEYREYTYRINHQDMLNEDSKSIKDTYFRKFVVLQDIFSNLIATKITSMGVIKQDLTEDDLKKKEALLVMICQDYLHEEPKFGLSADRDIIYLETTNLRIGIESNAKMNAQKRFFGLSKMQKAICRINGTWSTYNTLMNKERLSNEDLDTLNKMFL